MTDNNPYAGMTKEEAAGALAEIKASIKANENLVAFLASEAGKQLIEDKRADLNGTRKLYAKLNTKGEAEEIVRSLVRLQVIETLLAKELIRYDNAKKNNLELDKRLSAWYDYSRALGKNESSGR